MELNVNNRETAVVVILAENKKSIDFINRILDPQKFSVTAILGDEKNIKEISNEPPDLILIEIIAPDFKGLQYCHNLKNNSQTAHIPVITITEPEESTGKIKAWEAGANEVLSKPLDRLELTNRIKSLLRIKFYNDSLKLQNEKLVEQIEQLEKMDILKKELNGIIIHDIKNPLFVIQGTLQMINLAKDPSFKIDMERCIDRIESGTHRLSKMLANLDDINTMEEEGLKFCQVKIDLPTMIKQVLPFFLEQQENKTINYRIVVAENFPLVRFDKTILRRILENLLSFCFKNASENSTISVEAEYYQEEYVTLKFYHTGKKIPAELQNRVFDKLAQRNLKEAAIKLVRGLGLVFCKLALEANHGTIRLDSSRENGNGFIVRLPVWETKLPEQKKLDYAGNF